MSKNTKVMFIGGPVDGHIADIIKGEREPLPVTVELLASCGTMTMATARGYHKIHPDQYYDWDEDIETNDEGVPVVQKYFIRKYGDRELIPS